MRVLFLLNTFAPGYVGGAEISAYHTCRGLIRRGVECSILVVNNRMVPHDRDEYYEYESVPVHLVNFQTRQRTAWRDVFDGRIYHAVLSELARVKPDLVHMHNVSGATLSPYVACRFARVPVVNTLHDHWLLCPNNMLYRTDGLLCDAAQGHGRCAACFARYDYWGDIPYRRRVFAALTANVKFFIAPSQTLIRQHLRAGYSANRFRHVPHGLAVEDDLEKPHPLASHMAAAHGYDRNIIFAGGGAEIKGAGVLLDAIPYLRPHIQHLRVMVAGREGEERYLTRFRAEAPTVRLLGWVPPDQIMSLFVESDLVIVPSTWRESFSLVTLQGLQAGTPVVGSNFGGIQEIIRDGETGYLFPTGDAAALAERIIYHFSRPADLRRRMRQRCAAEAHTTYSLANHVNRILQVYGEASSH